MKFDMKNSVTRQEALSLMRDHWNIVPEREVVSLKNSLGRVTAEDIFSENTLPVVRSSRFDGVAVRSADFKNGLPDTSGWVKGLDFVRADTGDDFPDAFDTVIAIEDVILEGEKIRFADGFSFDPEEKTVNPAGDLVKSGSLLVPAHTKITPELMASLAMGGIAEIPVIRQIKIAFIPTGNELVSVGQKPARGQNVETNGLLLSALLTQRGAQVVCLPIVRDDMAMLEHALDEALSMADMVLINGGSSRGEEDFNSNLLQHRSSLFRHGVRAVPGRPVALSIIDGKPVINVPGPVVAAYLAEHWFLSALVNHYYGLPAPKYPVVTATLDQPVKKRPGFELIARVALRYSAERGYIATPVSWGKGGVPGLLLATDGFLNVPAETSELSAGDTVEIELLKSPELIQTIQK